MQTRLRTRYPGGEHEAMISYTTCNELSATLVQLAGAMATRMLATGRKWTSCGRRYQLLTSVGFTVDYSRRTGRIVPPCG